MVIVMVMVMVSVMVVASVTVVSMVVVELGLGFMVVDMVVELPPLAMLKPASLPQLPQIFPTVDPSDS